MKTVCVGRAEHFTAASTYKVCSMTGDILLNSKKSVVIKSIEVGLCDNEQSNRLIVDSAIAKINQINVAAEKISGFLGDFKRIIVRDNARDLSINVPSGASINVDCSVYLTVVSGSDYEVELSLSITYDEL